MMKQLDDTVKMSSFSPPSSSSPPHPSTSAPVSWVRGGCIGRGAYGTVSLGISKLDGRVFAVKSVDKSSCSPAQLDALENEISILKSLSSPFIVGYYADDLTIEEAEEYHSCHRTTATSTTRRIYRNLHMEYIPCAADARNYLSASSANGDYLLEKEEENEALLRRYTWCLVSALHYVHSNGIVHCDVKPNNVLLDSTSRIAKLADFGSSKRIDLHSSSASSSSSSKIVPRGSPLWMAPEVVRGESQGFESDVWSLGCTIIEIVTGKAAWNHQGGAETLFKIGYSDELPVTPTRLSECGRDFLDKCLKRDPNQRWSCHQLLQHPFLSGCSVSTNNKIVHVTTTATATDTSPRCVFDWTTDLEPSEEEEDEGGIEIDSCWNSDGESENVNWSDKIDKLATHSKVIWESDGWEVVRNLTEEVDDSATGADDDDYAYEDGDGSCFRGDEIEDDHGCQLAGSVSTLFNSLDAEVDIPQAGVGVVTVGAVESAAAKLDLEQERVVGVAVGLEAKIQGLELHG